MALRKRLGSSDSVSLFPETVERELGQSTTRYYSEPREPSWVSEQGNEQARTGLRSTHLCGYKGLFLSTVLSPLSPSIRSPLQSKAQ